jgi:hypothetical protein
MRHLELLPIIHHTIYERFDLEDKNKDLDRVALEKLCEKHKPLISINDYAFITKVVEEYGETILDPDQYKVE